MLPLLPRRLRRILTKLARRRIALLAIIFAAFWLTGASLFYLTERPRVGFGESLYWALITMSTVGYGDIVPSDAPARAVAAATAVFGIATYTLLISTLADVFLEATVKAAMGMGRLKGKRFLVIGEGPACAEAVRELAANGYADETGWVRETQPKGDPGVDFIVGELGEDTLKRAGIQGAEHVIICYDDDSKNLHAAALARKLNPNATLVALARDSVVAEILREIGVKTIVPLAILGRILASSAFEPGVAAFIADATTARGGTDLVEVEAPGKTVAEVEGETGYRAIAIVDRDGRVAPATPDRILREGEKLIALRQVKNPGR
ncbi:MAG: ion channel [Desulfurococcales archaeon]|nr:ion channel [Desulfurococcales archaeon]